MKLLFLSLLMCVRSIHPAENALHNVYLPLQQHSFVNMRSSVTDSDDEIVPAAPPMAHAEPVNQELMSHSASLDWELNRPYYYYGYDPVVNKQPKATNRSFEELSQTSSEGCCPDTRCGNRMAVLCCILTGGCCFEDECQRNVDLAMAKNDNRDHE